MRYEGKPGSYLSTRGSVSYTFEATVEWSNLQPLSDDFIRGPDRKQEQNRHIAFKQMRAIHQKVLSR